MAYTVQRLYAAAQHQGALTHLKLHANQLTVWRSIAPLPATEKPTDFPGLTPYRI